MPTAELLRDQAENAPVAQPLTPDLNKALAAFQKELPKIIKAATGEIRGVTRDGKPYSYSYEYAPLEDVSNETLPKLGDHGLAFTAFPCTDDQGRFVLEYSLLHESGQERTRQFPLWLLLPDRFNAQTLGGYVTYARRYCLGAVTGVAPAGDDNDAAGAQDAAPEPRGGAWMNRRPDVPSKDLQARRAPAPVTGAEHEQLRHGTVEATPGDRPAKRARGQAPEGDPWLDQPPGTYDETPPEERTGSIDGRQRSQIFAKLALLHITGADAQRQVLSDILHRDVSSRASLSYTEAAKVLDDLTARVEAKEAAEQANQAAAEQDAAEVDAP